MPRYFIEVAYKGTNYAGFQIQKNANSIQGEIEKALQIYFKQPFNLTCASRTDAGVHALQNYFHFDVEDVLITNIKNLRSIKDAEVSHNGGDLKGALYSLNALLPHDIVIKKIFEVKEDAHCRFDAVEREYKYFIYQNKNPFFQDRAYYYPFKIDIDKISIAANFITEYVDFTSFCKRHTQVKNFLCSVSVSNWSIKDGLLTYHVKANRFLRGMVRGMVATMLKVASGKISIDKFRDIIQNKDCLEADFSVPAHGLFLISITYKFINSDTTTN